MLRGASAVALVLLPASAVCGSARRCAAAPGQRSRCRPGRAAMRRRSRPCRPMRSCRRRSCRRRICRAAIRWSSFRRQATPPAPARRGPGLPIDADGAVFSFADLAEQLLDSVVYISTSQRVAISRTHADAAGRRRTPTPPPATSSSRISSTTRTDGETADPRTVQSLGSGFVIDPSGLIVTNNHVIADADEIVANFADGTQADRRGRRRRRQDRSRAAQGRRRRAPLKAARFGRSEPLRVGDWVLAIGNPFGFGGTVTAGIVSALDRDINSGPYDHYIQTDASINRGNSGGPLFNIGGEVVGINTAIMSPTGGSIGIGFAVPSEIAVPVIEQLRAVRRGAARLDRRAHPGRDRRGRRGTRHGRGDRRADRRPDRRRPGRRRPASRKATSSSSSTASRWRACAPCRAWSPTRRRATRSMSSVMRDGERVTLKIEVGPAGGREGRRGATSRASRTTETSDEPTPPADDAGADVRPDARRRSPTRRARPIRSTPSVEGVLVTGGRARQRGGGEERQARRRHRAGQPGRTCRRRRGRRRRASRS